jgi:hypothetical protein
MSEKKLFRVAADCERCTVGPHKIHPVVVAEDAHEALDRVTEHSNVKKLWDEKMQRAIVDGEISERRVERKYRGYVEEIEYAGEIE